MDATQHSSIISFVWGIADDVLRDLSSPNVQEILNNFEFRNQLLKPSKAGALGTLMETFLDPEINQSPTTIKNSSGTYPGLDNHAMGTVFEELARLPPGRRVLCQSRTGLCVGQRMMYLRPDPQLLDAKLLLQTIYGPTVRRYIEVSFAGSTVAHLRLGQVTSLPMPWCPVDEQRQIVRYVKTETCGLNKAAERAQVTINLLKEFRTRIISDVVPGNLDVRQAAAALPDESPDDADVKILDDDTDDEENVESTDEESDE